MRRRLEEGLKVLLKVAVANAQRSADPERASETNGQALSLSCLIDCGSNDDDLDAFASGSDALERRLSGSGADELKSRNDVGLDALLDRRSLGDNVLPANDAGDGFGLDLGGRSQAATRQRRQLTAPVSNYGHDTDSPILGDSTEELRSDAENLPLASERARRVSKQRTTHRSHLWRSSRESTIPSGV